MHGVKPLHVRKRRMHACKIREPRDTKRWTLVAIGYDLGTRPAQPSRRRQTSPGLPQHCDQKTRALHRAMTCLETADDGKERLLAWQARKVLDYIDRHITSRVRVADLGALVCRSEAYFSRSFRGTFGYSPHAFVIRRRVELAAKHMLQTDMSLSDIALGCGFVDQAHLCKHFRVVTGETPAAWRRANRAQGADMERVDGRGGGVLGEGVLAVCPTV
jgi:AraC family transcriptional regulator